MAKKKSISSWKKKSAFSIIAPDNFENRELGETVASDPKALIGRTVEISMKDLTGDRTKQYLKLIFEITGVKENKATTQIKGFKVVSGYLRSKVRKGAKKIEYVTDVNTMDRKLRMTIVVLVNRASSTHRKQINSKISKILEKYENVKFEQLVQLILYNKLGTELYHGIKNICSVSRVEIQKVKSL